MTRATDNRWSRGSSGATVPDEAVAAYGARWIDVGGGVADILPDRQGFAYSVAAHRDELADRLVDAAASRSVPASRDDEIVEVANDGPFHLWMRKAGGYVYVDAWLDRGVTG